MDNMKRTLIRTTKLAFLCTTLAGGLLALSNSASAFTIQGDHEFALINNERSSYANHLIRMHDDFNQRPHAMLADQMNSGSAGNVRDVPTISRPTIFRLSGAPPTGNGIPAPDGGTTVMLLGAALGALGLTRRYVRTE